MSTKLFDIRGATALVTGGSRGIGLFIARGLVEAGATVFITARNVKDCDAAAESLSAAGSCVSLPSDLSTIEGIEKLTAAIAARTPALNILVNNAGATWNESVETFPEAQWDTVLDLNLKAPFFLVQKLLPLLRAAATPDNPARVINIGSVAGLNPMRRESFAYAASKGGLHQMTRHLARHLAPLITVNTLAPGAFETPMIAFALKERAALEELIPCGTVGQADDIAGATIFLASRAGAYVTGAVIPVDGGMALKNP